MFNFILFKIMSPLRGYIIFCDKCYNHVIPSGLKKIKNSKFKPLKEQ
jgi:hypothetical protein